MAAATGWLTTVKRTTVKGFFLKYVTLNQCKLHVQRKVVEEVGGEEQEEEGRASEGEGIGE